MPCARALLAVLLGAGSAMVAGCGGASTPSTVKVSLTAPTDGATVAVRRIDVLGTIEPGNAVMLVSGKRIRVTHGGFRVPISLRNGVTRIRIKARAKGFVGSSMVISVRYMPPKDVMSRVRLGLEAA